MNSLNILPFHVLNDVRKWFKSDIVGLNALAVMRMIESYSITNLNRGSLTLAIAPRKRCKPKLMRGNLQFMARRLPI